MACKLLSDVASRVGGLWRIKGGKLVVIVDYHPSLPIIAPKDNPALRWGVPMFDLKRFATPVG